jgi:chitinase
MVIIIVFLVAFQHRIGYWASWSLGRACHNSPLASLDGSAYTDLIFAFAKVSGQHQLIPYQAHDGALYRKFIQLKTKFPHLKLHLAVGGWTFNDPPTGAEF